MGKKPTAFRQPKGRKHARRVLGTKVLNDRAWRASKGTRRRVCGCGLCRNQYEAWRGERLPRDEGNRQTIAEELEHARQLKDHQAIQEDGFSTWERPLPLPLGIYTTTPTPSPEPPQAKEAMMKHDDRTNARTSSRDRSIVMVRSGKARAKGLPPRLDCAIAPAAPRLTMAPDAEARAAEDAKYLAMRPVDPTTRKAEPVLPEGVWSLDDLIEDRKMVLLGM